MKLQGNYEKMNLTIKFIADVYDESYEKGVLDYLNTWDCKEIYIINNDIKDIVKSIKNFMENHLYYKWENLEGIEYDRYIKNIQGYILVNEDNEELSKSEYSEFKKGKNMYSLNFTLKLKINGIDIEDKDLKNVINEINKTFEN